MILFNLQFYYYQQAIKTCFCLLEWCQTFSDIVWNVSKFGVFSGPYFPALGLNTDQKKLRIWTLFPQWERQWTRFMPLVSFYTPWKHQKTSRFSDKGIEIDQWHEIGYDYPIETMTIQRFQIFAIQIKQFESIKWFFSKLYWAR